MIEVVTALIVKHSRLFLQQRHANRSEYPLMWECPGGKMESKDRGSWRRTIRRELREELRWIGDLNASQPMYRTLFTAYEAKNSVTLTFYVVRSNPQWEPELHDAIGFGWFTLDEMRGIVLAPGVERLLKYFVSHGTTLLDDRIHSPR